MSGIAGVYHLDGRPAGEELDRILRAMEHRGPDGARTWTEGSLGLGHLMLETTPEDRHESLPLVDRTGNFAITADARIDNRDALIKKLDIQTGGERPVTDTEVILAAYKRWGRDCPKHLLGAFAFAVWDARDHTLTLARDHFGIRPLSYVHRAGRYFAFASEEKALLEAGFSEGELNELKIADFLMLPVEIEPEATYWTDVFSVRRAHTLEMQASGKIDQKRYWALDPTQETTLGSDGAYVDRFRELFREAVQCRMRRTKPLGSTLSGGLDSTSIACAAAQELDAENLHTFSAVYPSIPEADEREYQEAAVDMYREEMDPTFIPVDETSPLAHAGWFTRHLGVPNDGVNAFILIEVYKRAAGRNLRVMLSGNDGDTVVSHGRAYYNELLWSWRWRELWTELRERVQASGGSVKDLNRTLVDWGKHYLRKSPVTSPLVRVYRSLFRGGISEEEEEKGLETRREGGAWKGDWRSYFDDQFVRSFASLEDGNSSDQRWMTERMHHHKLLTRPLMESAFRKYDALGNALGLDIRFPFHDVRLVEFCLSLPGHLKRRGTWDRWIQHASMEGILPETIQQRKDKTDVRWVYINGLTEYESNTLSSFSERLSRGQTPVAQYVDQEEVSELARKMASGDLNRREQEAERMLLWRVLSLHHWMESSSRSKTPQRVEHEAV